MNKKLSILGLLSLVLVITYCSNNYFGRVLTRNSSFDPKDINKKPIDVPDGADPSQDYFNVDTTYPPQQESGTVRPEILFVLDTSGSMVDEKNALIAALGGWLENLQSQGIESFCVDVMESAYNANSGLLRSASGNAKCLCTDDLTVSEIVTKFAQNANSINFTGGAGEAGIYSLHQALNNPTKLAANQAAGCFRADSALAVIQMSDENDHGATVRPGSELCGGGSNATRSDGTVVTWNTVQWDNSIFPELDGQYVTSPQNAAKFVSNSCDEAQARLRYYAEATPTGPGGTYRNVVTAATVGDSMVNYNDALPSFGTALIYNTTTFPTNSGAESKGWGFFEFASFFGQETANLATTNNQANFNAQLNNIADALVDVVSFVYKFTLPEPVCAGQESSVVVKVNGSTIPASRWSLNSLRTWIRFKPDFDWNAHGGSGAVVSIDYTSCE